VQRLAGRGWHIPASIQQLEAIGLGDLLNR
jgi:hypothetical protein